MFHGSSQLSCPGLKLLLGTPKATRSSVAQIMRQTIDPFCLIWMRVTGVSYLLMTRFCWCGQPAPSIFQLLSWKRWSTPSGSVMNSCPEGEELKIPAVLWTSEGRTECGIN